MDLALNIEETQTAIKAVKDTLQVSMGNAAELVGCLQADIEVLLETSNSFFVGVAWAMRAVASYGLNPQFVFYFLC